MSEALRTLEQLRRDALERARRELVRTRAEHAARLALVRELSESAAQAACALGRAREAFAQASDVRALRWASAQVRAAELERSAVEARFESAQRACTHLADQVRAQEHAIRELELGRRIVARVLEQQSASARRRSEQRAEDEAEDTFRARAARRDVKPHD